MFLVDALVRGDIEAEVGAVVDAWTLPDAPPELRERVADMQRRALTKQVNEPEVPEAPDPLDQTGLTEIAVPAVVGRRAGYAFREAARRMADQMPVARQVEIPGAGHLAPLETAEAFRELLVAFLAGR